MKVLESSAEEEITEKLHRLRSRNAKLIFMGNILYPSMKKGEDITVITQYTENVEKLLPEIKELIYLFRKYIPHIWDQNKLTASYLLVCKAFAEIKPIIFLAKDGSSHEMVELTRSGIEALDLAFLFLEEDDGVHLNQWLKGKIIKNFKARKIYQKIINTNRKQTIPFNDIKSDVYWLYSLFTHNSYSALLESIDLFNEDYDFQKYSGYHYTAESLHLIQNLLINILFILQNVFLKLGNTEGFEKAQILLGKVGFSRANEKEIEEITNAYKEVA